MPPAGAPSKRGKVAKDGAVGKKKKKKSKKAGKKAAGSATSGNTLDFELVVNDDVDSDDDESEDASETGDDETDAASGLIMAPANYASMATVPPEIAEFVACEAFDGAREGFIFKSGDQGVGYYPAVAAAVAPASDEAAASTAGPSVTDEASQQQDVLDLLESHTQALGLDGASVDTEGLRATLAAQRLEVGDAHPTTLASITQLAAALVALGDLESAVPLLREAVDAHRASSGDGGVPEAGAEAMSTLGSVLAKQGKEHGEESAALASEALAAFRALLGDTHDRTVSAIYAHAMLLKRQENYEAAQPLLREALDAKRAALGDAHLETLGALAMLAEVLKKLGAVEEATGLLQEAAATALATLGADHAKTKSYQRGLSALLEA